MGRGKKKKKEKEKKKKKRKKTRKEKKKKKISIWTTFSTLRAIYINVLRGTFILLNLLIPDETLGQEFFIASNHFFFF
jgi:Na+/glutamate symporter